MSAIWHDLECGAYAEDLTLWRSLAAEHGGPVLDVGAGPGRVALDLARHGYDVTALDRDAALLQELERRAGGLPVTTALADARAFDLGRRFALCLVPMQTIQLLPDAGGRRAFLRCARRHLAQGAVLAIALSEELEIYEILDGMPGPHPDIREVDGVVYSSRPMAVRAEAGSFVLERRRETVTAAGERTVEDNRIRLTRVTCEQLEREAVGVGLRPWARATIAETAEYAGSEVVMLGG